MIPQHTYTTCTVPYLVLGGGVFGLTSGTDSRLLFVVCNLPRADDLFPNLLVLGVLGLGKPGSSSTSMDFLIKSTPEGCHNTISLQGLQITEPGINQGTLG